MLFKGLVFTALVASTPLAIVATQDPRPTPAAPEQNALKTEVQRLEALARKNAADLGAARAELEAARTELNSLGKQLAEALDALDRTYEPQRDRNCSPSRSRALMSHYQWLRDHGHEQRAGATLAKVVEQAGDNPQRLNSAAWELMTNAETAGKFDDVALAYAQRMEQHGESLSHHHLDTVALAHFLNGQVERAVELQQQAIERGGNADDYRRRLRTYEAAKAALVKCNEAARLPAATMIAGNDD
jgi:tetratricopeptide (TPR) repeat protein